MISILDKNEIILKAKGSEEKETLSKIFEPDNVQVFKSASFTNKGLKILKLKKDKRG